MSKSKHIDEIYDWLKAAATFPYGELVETFYFDCQTKELVSLLLGDFWMFDEKGERDKSIQTPYTKETEAKIIEKVKAYDPDGKRFIPIDRISDDQRRKLMLSFIMRNRKNKWALILEQNARQIEETKKDVVFEGFTKGVDDRELIESWNSTLDEFLDKFVQTVLESLPVPAEEISIMKIENEGSSDGDWIWELE